MPDTGMDPGGQPDTWRQWEDWVCLKVAACAWGLGPGWKALGEEGAGLVVGVP